MSFSVNRVENISGIDDFTEKIEYLDEVSDHPIKARTLLYKIDKVFMVINRDTIELRTDAKLRDLLREKYESVMESRYFGRGGIEIVLAGQQLTEDEIADLIRLSYNLT